MKQCYTISPVLTSYGKNYTMIKSVSSNSSIKVSVIFQSIGAHDITLEVFEIYLLDHTFCYFINNLLISIL